MKANFMNINFKGIDILIQSRSKGCGEIILFSSKHIYYEFNHQKMTGRNSLSLIKEEGPDETDLLEINTDKITATITYIKKGNKVDIICDLFKNIEEQEKYKKIIKLGKTD